MKQTSIPRRLLSLLLALLMLSGVAVFAAESRLSDNELPILPIDTAAESEESVLVQPAGDNELPVIPISNDPDPEPPAEEYTDEQLIAMYNIPDNWARPALLFAVRKGLLQGKGANNLAPTANTTRAEVASMLMRVLRTTTEADLSKFTDVKSSEWYYQSMARAVAAGLFSGSDNKLMPNNKITREQAFAVLARMFGVYSSDFEAVYQFSDGGKVSSWAMGTMAGMVKAGYISGANNKLNPQSSITRQELAQVLYKLLADLGTELPYQFVGNYALAADTIAPGSIVIGDLLLSNEAPDITLQNVRIDGRLTIQGVGALNLTLINCRIGSLSICRPTTMTVNGGTITTVTTLAETTTDVSCSNLNIHAKTTYGGYAQNALLFDGELIATQDATINTLTVESGTAVNYGTIGTAEIFVKDFFLGGTGSVRKLVAYKKNITTSNTVTSRDDSKIDPGIANVEARRKDNNVPTEDNPSITMTVAFSNFGSYQSTRFCDVVWSVGSQVLSRSNGLKMEENMQVSCTANFKSLIAAGQESVKINVAIYYEGERQGFNLNIALPKPAVVDTSMVRTQNVQGTINYTAYLFTGFDPNTLQFSGATGGTIAAGTQVTLLYVSKNTGAKIRTKDGDDYWVAYSAVKASEDKFYTTDYYSTEVKEYYVNKVRNWDSQTNYLIWVSLWTQQVNIFIGSKGHWVLYRSDPCSSGANECPTPVESVKILYKTPGWYYTNYYVHSVSVFDATRGFHSWPIKNGTADTVYDDAMGWPNSNSCIRMMDEAVRWLYDNVPVNTAVEIY